MLKLFRKKVDPKQALREALGETELPTFPAVVATALDRVRDDDTSTAEVSDLVASDPGLSVRLLAVVNSASFALRHQVRNVHHAVSLLGRNQLESLLISIAVGKALPNVAARGYDAARFWRASARRATTARALAELIEPATRSESFTASLLQDLAIPLLAERKGDLYGQVLEQWHGGSDGLVGLEQQAFGVDHAEVAWWVCNDWGFPDPLAQAIGGHHADDDSIPFPAVRLVADLREVDEQPSIDQLVERVRERYQVAEDQTVELVRTSFESAEEIARMFSP